MSHQITFPVRRFSHRCWKRDPHTWCRHIGPGMGLPYGETFFHKPTGRFTDGRIIADYIASALNLPFVNAYLDKSGVSFSQGANFAVAGATAMNNSFLVEKGIGLIKYNVPLSSQLEWFKSHLQSTCGSKCARTLRNSLVVLGEFGGVEYWNAFAGVGNKSEPEVRTYVPLIIDGIKSAIKDVIQLGSTRILVPGVFPFGCLSGYLARFPDTNLDATTVCPNPSQYVNWDGLHLTYEAYHRISDVVINNMLPKFGCCGLGNSSVLSSY
ncbi:hypothetical protein H5410_063484 [Solanum commersonii]|uniref:GDSL esterase/lipase n=1 Tax=Solanum commersonii TaxID=4109 RepID=A0A9J5WFS7_SOLCO|nr:hypothetical protein H5410_063484 [Solanum commersonii]